jgi:hypothetical protein
MMTSMRRALILVGALVLAGTACENTTPSEVERQQVEAAVRAYLDGLTRAYSELSVAPLEGLATGSEIADVRTILQTLASSGDRVEAHMRTIEFMNMEVFREVNATVTLVEVWDVVRFDAYTGREKGRNDSSVQSSIIQLRRIEGRWMVTARRVRGLEAGPRWAVTTPTPEAKLR